MYWYKIRLNSVIIAAVLLLLGVPSCMQDGGNKDVDKKYFDLKGFFIADTARLRKLNPLVNKTVTYNGKAETKKTYIKDWGSELGLFIESDINKPAWKQSYSVIANTSFLIYRATDPALRTREIIIKRAGNKVKWILISNHTKNSLYETVEKLSYYPDSVYLIQKMQRVKLTGTNNYRISGEL